MVDGFNIDPSSLRSAGTSIDNIAQQLSDSWSQLAGQADSTGDIFGDDMVGGLIGASYNGALDVADESFTAAVDGFGEVADGLSSMADMYDDTEQGNTDDLSSQAM